MPLSERKQVARARNAGHHRMDWVRLILRWRCRTGQIVNLVYGLIDFHKLANVLLYQPETRMVRQWPDIIPTAGNITVDANDPIAPCEKGITEMRSDEAGTSCTRTVLPFLRRFPCCIDTLLHAELRSKAGFSGSSRRVPASSRARAAPV